MIAGQGDAADLPRGRSAPALGAVRSAVRADVAALLRVAGTVPAPGAGPPEGLPLVLVALSGGADSLALAAAAGAEAAASRRRARTPGPGSGPSPRRPPPFRAGALVVDHRWSAGSGRVAAEAADAARALGLDPVEVLVPGRPGADQDAAPSEGGNREARARAQRYAALEAACARHGAVAILLGHTADDQAEQVLLGLARGSGARSLAGMPAVRGPLRRPLLALTRSATAVACREGGLEPWQDPSNDDPAHARVRVRHRVLPVLEAELGPGIGAALVRSADQLREDAELLDTLAEELVARAVSVGGEGCEGGEGCTVVDLAALRGVAPALLTRTLRSAALSAGCPASALSRRHVLALVALGDPRAASGPLHLPGLVAAQRRCGTLRLWTRVTQAPTSPRSS